MLSRTRSGRRQWQACLSVGFLLGLIPVAAAQGDPASAAKGPATAGIEALVARGLLTLHADGAPLAEVLRAIGAAGGFEVALRGGFATPVRESFADRPLEDVIRRLVAGHSVVIAYAAPDPAYGTAAPARIAVIENPNAASAGSAQLLAPVVAEAQPGAADDDEASGRASFCEGRHRVPPLAGDDLVLEAGEPCPAARATAAPEAGSPAARAAIETAARAFANADATGRSRAVAALTRLEGPGARRLLRERALADDHLGLRTQALNVLARSQGERAINVLAQALRQDPEPKVRINAIRALGRLGGDRARRILEHAARDLDLATSLAAERALAAWRSED